MNVLFIGPCSSEWALVNRPVSLAATKWTAGLLKALQKNCHVQVLTHSFENTWPKGKTLWCKADAKLFPNWIECTGISYPPVKYIREYWLERQYSSKAEDVIKKSHIDVVLFYNCYFPWQVGIMRHIKQVFGNAIKVIPIILDGDDPRKDDWQWIKRAARWSDGIAMMSWWVYENCPCKLPLLHFDGGSDGWNGTFPESMNPKVRLVHTGSLDQWRGFDFMIDVVDYFRGKDIEFVFCGKTSAKALEKEFHDCSNVRLLGMVEESRLTEICSSADVLLNVRDPNHPDNILNYPSKLPHYLSFGRPVVSTRLQSLGPEYAEVVNYPEDDTVQSYCKKVEEVLAWGLERKQVEYRKIKTWFDTHKRWNMLADTMVEWLTSL